MPATTLTFSHVSFTYPDGTEALRDVSFRICPGEKVALMGSNGAGKSTLLLHCNGLLLPNKGVVRVGEMEVMKSTLREVRTKVGMLFQNADDQLFMPTVEEDVAFGPRNMQLPEDEVKRRVTEALHTVGSEALRNRACHRLSGGQKRMVAIAGVWAMQPEVWVMDEPATGLDAEARECFIQIVASLPTTCLIATHDLSLAHRLCSRIIYLEEGCLQSDCKVVKNQLPG